MQANLRRNFLPLCAGALLTVSTLAGCDEPSDVFLPGSPEHDDVTIRSTIATLDQTDLPAETLADLYLADAVILQPGQPEVRGRDAIIKLMTAQANGPALEMTHRIDELTRFEDVIVIQGGVTGVVRPTDGSEPIPFATKNLILFKRDPDRVPKIWKVIFNNVPAEEPAFGAGAD